MRFRPHPAALLAALAAATAVHAQPPASASPVQGGADPAPGATLPYLGHPHSFQDPLVRLEALEARAATLPHSEARAVGIRLKAIHADVDVRRARNGGDLRDWDRERLERMMNEVVHLHPALRS